MKPQSLPHTSDSIADARRRRQGAHRSSAESMCPDRRLRQISLRPKSRPWTWSSLHSTNDGKQHDERLQLDEDARSGGRIDLDEPAAQMVRSQRARTVRGTAPVRGLFMMSVAMVIVGV